MLRYLHSEIPAAAGKGPVAFCDRCLLQQETRVLCDYNVVQPRRYTNTAVMFLL